MNCEKCGREIDVIEADMFNSEGNDDWVRFVIHSEAGSEAVRIDITADWTGYDLTADWTGYDLTHDEGLECVRCPHCHQYPFKNENFEIDDKTVGIIFWPDTGNIKKPTNLDRIREMSAEELTEWLKDRAMHGFCEVCSKKDTGRRCDENDCTQGVIAWLNQKSDPTAEES